VWYVANEKEDEMAKYVINKGFKTEKDVEADSFQESGSLVLFTLDVGGIVFALPTAQVHSIERVQT